MDEFVTDRRGRPISVIVSVVLAIVTLGYFLPWMIAALRGKANAWTIFWVNLLVGWTLIGWIVALVMACSSHQVVGFRPRR
ncbi:superinfection immunity protein [Nocardioides zeae]|uniref:Superinfection immunity protein n=1 Tax=Nocardioides imazamoxiresistens TaxID=3231893 RepID=A0ABU3PXR9_9ACTN|nr:superinfection immunity protein [Nocardioides zeae]MDT9593580.1 superinfection immunity protein [Nocardioides zeae]